MVFGRNPDKLEAKALNYERRGKTVKALKYREKAARLRSNGAIIAPQTSTFSTYRTPQVYEQNALKWEQRGNWTKAQKNREKIWRMNNPQYGSTTMAPSFYNNNQFLGYNVPLTGAPLGSGLAGAPLGSGLSGVPLSSGFSNAPLGGAPLSSGFSNAPLGTRGLSNAPLGSGLSGAPLSSGFSNAPLSSGLAGAPLVGTQSNFPPVLGRNPERLESKALDYERRGKTAKALKYREKAQRLRASPASATNTTGFTSMRTPQRYEQNALKWEQRNNWTKAQKNREKVWRLQNPQYGLNNAAPSFYQNNRFLGYNVPLTGAPLASGPILSKAYAPTVETHVRPTIVDQTVRPERIVEVQPIVHREVVAPEVHVVEKHMYEQVRSTGPSTITKQAIVQETVKPRIIEEIQPIVHREVPAPFVERVEQHVTEHITKPTTMTKEVLNDATVRTAAPGFAAGGPIPLQQKTTTTTTTTTQQQPLGARRL